MIADIIKRVEAMVVLPDSWIVTNSVPIGTLRNMIEPITAGDLRALVARIRECEASAKSKRRDELVRVAATIYAANRNTMTAEVARNHASDLIDRCEGFLPDDDDDLESEDGANS